MNNSIHNNVINPENVHPQPGHLINILKNKNIATIYNSGYKL